MHGSVFFELIGCAAAGFDLSKGEVVGSSRACQRPRTSSMATCFACEGASTKDLQIFNFFEIYTKIFLKPVLRCPRPRPRRLAPLRCPSLATLARRPNALRAAQPIITYSQPQHDKMHEASSHHRLLIGTLDATELQGKTLDNSLTP